METKETKDLVENPIEKPVENLLLPLSSLWGKESDDVTRALLARSDIKNHADLIITNIIDNSHRREGNITIVVSKPVPQYILNAGTGAYELSSVRNVFTTRIQLAAILKSQGETQLAKIVELAPFSMIVPILERGRISVLSHVLSAGEAYTNPYATKAPSEERHAEHDTIEFYPYELKLAMKLSVMEKFELAMMIEKMEQMKKSSVFG